MVLIWAAKIILFMKYKKQALEKAAKIKQIEIPDYFTEKDKQAVMKWSVFGTQRVWLHLKTSVYEDKGLSGLPGTLCPFCCYYFFMSGKADCPEVCAYGKEHGYCNTEDPNDYKKIMEAFDQGYPLHSSLQYQHFPYDLLPNEDYRKIIEKVETLSEKYIKTLWNNPSYITMYKRSGDTFTKII